MWVRRYSTLNMPGSNSSVKIGVKIVLRGMDLRIEFVLWGMEVMCTGVHNYALLYQLI